MVAARGLARHHAGSIRALQFRLARTVIGIFRNYAYYKFRFRSGAPSYIRKEAG
jgi:hypothetical protein